MSSICQLQISLAVAAGACIIVGAMCTSFKPRDQWGKPNKGATLALIILSFAHVAALRVAFAQVSEYPFVQSQVLGCTTAVILAVSVTAAYWMIFPNFEHQIMISRCFFSIMMAIPAGIIFEITTGIFAKAALILGRRLERNQEQQEESVASQHGLSA
jgi:hypothetical protein